MMNNPTTQTRWLMRMAPDTRARVRLFCFPYAGGSALIFRKWPELLSPAVEVCPVYLPGRGPRMQEPLLTDVHSVVEAFLPFMAEHLNRPFALFGHSMGGAIAFELARRLRHTYGVEPQHLFISGRRAPHLPSNERPLHSLPEQEFKDELRRLNGTPPEVLEHDELMQMMLPLLRADFSVSETYKCESRPSLSCPLTVLSGLQDTHAEPACLESWREHTVGRFNQLVFNGDHFFINTAQRPVLRALESALLGR
jgi:medium-chain acyl-[acyl-carrier-protein] hydrolase